MVYFTGADFSQRTAVATLPGVKTPICEGSLVAHAGVLYFSHPESVSQRTNLTIHRSDDNGKTWPRYVVVWPATAGASGYSGMTAMATGLGITFNQWPSDDKKSSKDGPGQRIAFTTVPYAAFV